MKLPLLVRKLDPVMFYPYTDDPRVKKAVEEVLGVYQPMVTGRGGERLMTPPPEGVIRGESVPSENDRIELEELLAKARERRIRSLERQDRLKKEEVE